MIRRVVVSGLATCALVLGAAPLGADTVYPPQPPTETETPTETVTPTETATPSETETDDTTVLPDVTTKPPAADQGVLPAVLAAGGITVVTLAAVAFMLIGIGMVLRRRRAGGAATE